MSLPAEAPRRLFLALWPDDALRRRLADLAQNTAGRRALRPDNLHLTLVFLGATAAGRLACYENALADLAVPPLTLTLDRLGYFPRPRILWLGASHVPPALYGLVADLNRRLAGCGFALERRPFQPHITLARRYSGAVPVLAEAVVWSVDQVSLMESVASGDGVGYQLLRRWPGG
ncbi:MAG: RNA 2',3'-cyclic phosphodiesterase [Pseudomonadota bacterium]|nr:RNA 2',3'-cyclic phosphodiesterase [Pseudomonadota bacterium]